jgi:hypothetical protein
MLIRDHLVCRFARAYWAARKSSGRLRLNRALARFWKQWRMSTSRPRALAAGGEHSNWDSVIMALDVGCLLVRSLLPNRGAKVSVWRRTTVDHVQSLRRISLERELSVPNPGKLL